MKEDFALIIGINDYTPVAKAGLRTLLGAVNDANRFEDWVTSSTGGKVPIINTKKIISAPIPLKPLQDEIDSAYLEIEQSIIANGGSAGRLYFYFAGHGLGTLDSTEDTALCLANWSEYRRQSALSSESYKDFIKQYGYFDEIIFIADCCRNTKINIKPQEPNFSSPVPGERAGATKMFVAYATQYQDQSFEVEADHSEKRGAFTTVLIEALNGAAGKNGVIGADDLRDYLMIQTPILAQTHGYKQNPVVSHNFIKNAALVNGGDILVDVNIYFNTHIENPIELLDGNLTPIASYDTAKAMNYTVQLKTGLYLLRDTIAEKFKHFQVSPSQINVDVNF